MAQARLPPVNPVRVINALASLAGVAGVGALAYNSMYNVKVGERAIVFSRLHGIGETVYKEGTNFYIPWLERPIVYDVRSRPRTVQSLSGTRDMQMVQLNLRVLTHPDPNKLASIYRTLGEDYDERVLPSIVNEVTKQVVAQFGASQLLTQREQVSRKIQQGIQERLRTFHIVLESVAIADLQFDAEFMSAVEAKQVAQQEAERARFVVEKAEQDKRSMIIKAKGEARAAEMIGKAVARDPGFVELKRIETAKEVASVLARSNNTIFLQSDSLLLNLLSSVGISDTTKGAAAAAAAAAKKQ